MPIPAICEQCGVSFETWPSYVAAGRGRFCSVACRGLAARRGKNRYLMVNVKGRAVYVHRKMWEDAYGPIPSGYDVHHKNDDTYDNRLDNFELLLKGDHTRLHHQGERSYNAVLTESAVRDIRARYAAGGVTLQTLADEYGVHLTAIFKVVHRESWTHI